MPKVAIQPEARCPLKDELRTVRYRQPPSRLQPWYHAVLPWPSRANGQDQCSAAPGRICCAQSPVRLEQVRTESQDV